jgi:hypothetical protein
MPRKVCENRAAERPFMLMTFAPKPSPLEPATKRWRRVHQGLYGSVNTIRINVPVTLFELPLLSPVVR